MSSKNVSNSGSEITMNKETPFSVAEAYKTIRTNLMFVLPNKSKKTIAISSSLPGEGKSTTALNVGISFSQLDQRVLLIDGDMRNPTIYKKLKINNSKGLSSILVGFCEIDEAVKNIYPNFDVLTSGPLPPNPAELLGSDNMSELLKVLNDYYDCIIIDTPPINVVSDALILTPKTDGLVMVVRQNVSTHDQLKRSLKSIEFANVKFLGSILNGVKMDKQYSYKSKY